MKQLSSVTESFNILLGTPVINLAFFITLLTVIHKPPHYSNGYKGDNDIFVTAEELNKAAKISFYSLVILHFLTACF